MSFLKLNSNDEEKEIKDIINKNVASSFRTQPSFVELLKLNGCPIIKVGFIGSEIRQQLLMEAENGDLTVDTVMPRAYSVIGEYLEIKNIRTFDDLNNYKAISISQTGFDAALHYLESDVQYESAGKNSFEKSSHASTTLGEGRTEWESGKVLFEKDGLRIVESEQFIFYKQVDHVEYSQFSNKKGFLDIKRNSITFFMKNGEQVIMGVMADEFDAIKQAIDRNITETSAVNKNDDIGLINCEESDFKNEELNNNAEDNSLLNQEHVRKLYCSNCGIKLAENANFCHNCGNKVK